MTPVSVITVGLFVAAYQSYVSWHVWTDSTYSSSQKIAQLTIIWLVPIVGAGIVHWVLHGQARSPEAPSGQYAEEQRYEDLDPGPQIFDD
jgi:hypothetical protein